MLLQAPGMRPKRNEWLPGGKGVYAATDAVAGKSTGAIVPLVRPSSHPRLRRFSGTVLGDVEIITCAKLHTSKRVTPPESPHTEQVVTGMLLLTIFCFGWWCSCGRVVR